MKGIKMLSDKRLKDGLPMLRGILLFGAVMTLPVIAGCANIEGNTGAKPQMHQLSPIEYVAPELREAFRQRAEAWGNNGVTYSDETLARFRIQADKLGSRSEVLAEPRVEEVMIPGPEGAPDVRVYVIGAHALRKRPAILFMHGGGYIIGAAKSDVPRLQELAQKHDGVIVTVDYRLAPETGFPGSLEDNYAALKWLSDNADKFGVDRERIVVMGDSAGGGHAAMLAIAARDRGEIPIKAQILTYPMLDDRTGSTRTMPYWMGYGSWSPAANQYGWSALLGVPAGSEQVPAGAVPARVKDLSGLPDTFIRVGSIDLFAEENIEYARRLVHAGVPTELVVIPGGFHGFQRMMPEAELSKQFNEALDTAITKAFGVRAKQE
jgi:acetyl esterase/lipase